MKDLLIELLRDLFHVPNVILASLLFLALIVLMSALQLPRFRLGDMIVDESGKASSSRVAMFIALGLSSYMLAYLTINNVVDSDTLFYIYAVYLLTWASSKTLDKLVTNWAFNRNLPSRFTEPKDGEPYTHRRGERREVPMEPADETVDYMRKN
jgi:hypothetical protein